MATKKTTLKNEPLSTADKVKVGLWAFQQVPWGDLAEKNKRKMDAKAYKRKQKAGKILPWLKDDIYK